MADITLGQNLENSVVADTTGYMPATAVLERMQRREARYKLRSALRQVTNNKRLRYCGLPIDSDIVVRRKDGVHHFAALPRLQDDPNHFSGILTCGSGWCCPVCSAKVRFHRADEVSRAVVAALQQGLGATFVTRTIPHSSEARLGVTLNLLAEGRRYVANQPAVKAARREVDFVGFIAAKEITYGAHGAHPHTHDIEFHSAELSLQAFARLSEVYYHYLQKFYSAHGFDGLSRLHGVRLEQVQLDGAALAHYMAKLQEGGFRLRAAHELTRADLKKGKAGSINPFDIASAFFGTGDLALLDLWHEFERETFGRSVIRFTKGLRARLLPNEAERTNGELASMEVGGTGAVHFEGWFYYKIAAIPGLEGKVLTALDTGGFAALVELLTVYHLDNQGGYRRLAGDVKEGL